VKRANPILRILLFNFAAGFLVLICALPAQICGKIPAIVVGLLIKITNLS
jgi:hypothetical protein